MSNLTNVQTNQEINGVNFYVSEDGETCGMSIRGLAKLVNEDHRKISKLCNWLISSGAENQVKIPERLVPCQGFVASQANSGFQNAKIIPSKVCASILKHYAFDLKNEVALYACEKFMETGIDSWIKKIVGFSTSDKSLALLETLNATMGKLMVKMERLEEIEEETLGYRKATVTLPVLEKWMNELSEMEKEKILAPSETRYTIKEALAELYPGVTFTPTHHKKLALKVGQTIAGLSDSKIQKKETPNGKGYMQLVNSYSIEQLPLIRLCMNSIISEF